MEIFVDADACPAVGLIVEAGRKHGVPVTLLCDTNHVLSSDYASVRTVGAGADAVDFALVNLCRAGDVVVTQDYGLAAMALAKGARVLHPMGKRYSQDNIQGLLMDRHLGSRARRGVHKHYGKGPRKRTPQDDARLRAALEELLEEAP